MIQGLVGVLFSLFAIVVINNKHAKPNRSVDSGSSKRSLAG